MYIEIEEIENKKSYIIDLNKTINECKIDSTIFYHDKKYNIKLFLEDFKNNDFNFLICGKEVELKSVENYLLVKDLEEILHIHNMLYFTIEISNNSKKNTFYSNKYELLYSNDEDNQNINFILMSLFDEDEEIQDIIYNKNSSNNLSNYKNKFDYKILNFNKYINTIKKNIDFLKTNYIYFKNHSFNKIINQSKKMTADKVKKLTVADFHNIMKNPEELKETNYNTNIKFNGKFYYLNQVVSQIKIKDYDIYENKLIISFINDIILKTHNILIRYKTYISEINSKINNFNEKSFQYKRLQMLKTLFNTRLNVIIDLSKELKILFKIYNEIFKIKKHIQLKKSIKPTKIFVEVPIYKNVFKLIQEWIAKPLMSTELENSIFEFETLDILYEYYCLQKLIKKFKQKYDYIGKKYFNYRIYKEECIKINSNNTFEFKDKNVKFTIYYQPILKDLENNLTLFRADIEYAYFTPDFIIKIENIKTNKYCYIILDAKYSSTITIKKHSYKDIVDKYFIKLADKNSLSNNILGSGILQGKLGNTSMYIPNKYNLPLIFIKPFNIDNLSFDDLFKEFRKIFDKIKSS